MNFWSWPCEFTLSFGIRFSAHPKMHARLDAHGMASCGLSRKNLSAAICLRDLDDLAARETEEGDGDLELSGVPPYPHSESDVGSGDLPRAIDAPRGRGGAGRDTSDGSSFGTDTAAAGVGWGAIVGSGAGMDGGSNSGFSMGLAGMLLGGAGAGWDSSTACC